MLTTKKQKNKTDYQTMLAIRQSAIKKNKDSDDNVRLGTLTLRNTEKTKQSIQKAKAESSSGRERIGKTIEIICRSLAESKENVEKEFLDKFTAEDAVMRKAQRAGHVDVLVESKIRTLALLIKAIKNEKTLLTRMTETTKQNHKIIAEMGVLEASFRRCLHGVKNTCSHMLTQKRPFFSSMANLMNNSQFLSDEQVHAMDIKPLIEECNRNMFEDPRAFKAAKLAAVTPDDIVIAPIDEDDAAHRKTASKGEILKLEKIYRMCKKDSSYVISDAEKQQLVSMYNHSKKTTESFRQFFDTRAKEIRMHFKHFAEFVDSFQIEMDRVDKTVMYQPRIVVDD